MSMRAFLKSLTSPPTRRRPARRRPPASRLCLEPLDDRCLPSFGLPVTYGSDLAAQTIVAADFNGDGRLDLAAAYDDASYTVGVLLGNGDGTFQAARTSAAGPPGTLVAADLNGDGRDDLVTSAMGVLLANGDGTFQPPRALTLPEQTLPGNPELGPLWQHPVSVAVGDFDGDGTLDLVAGGRTQFISDGGRWYGAGYANILLGTGDGTFRLTSVKPLPGGYPILQPGDFNNDGRLDIVLNGSAALGNGDGTLRDFVHSSVHVGDVPQPVGDFDGDGRLDVLSYTGGPFLQLGNGDGTFQPGRYLDRNYSQPGTAAGDVNADGKLDVVNLASDYSGEVYEGYADITATTRSARVLLGHGSGSFAQPVSAGFGTAAGQTDFTSPVLADFDGDGFPDLAATEKFTPSDGGPVVYRGVHVALNDGTWTLPPPPPPSITLSDVTVTEGNTGTRAATFTVTLSAAYGQPVTVSYATADGTAAAGSDYQAATGTLTIPAGQRTGTITVQVSGDRLGEPAESFSVNLGGPTNAVIADGRGVGTIVDDEPRIGISGMTRAEGKKGQTTLFTFTVTLSAAYDQAVTVSFRTADGTATSGSGDYAARTGALTFAPGETTRTVTIEVKGDGKQEVDEYFYLDLFGNSGNSLFTRSRGLGTILNDD